MNIVFVITWQYLDGSGMGLVGAYRDPKEAEQVLKLLTDFGNTDKQFIAHQVQFNDGKGDQK